MIEISNVQVFGFEAAIRGARNPYDSWAKSDSRFYDPETGIHSDGQYVGPNDLALLTKLVNAGTDHSKFMRMINVTADIKAPRFWWAEYDTYKVGTVANSCSTMHTIHKKEFTLDDFSHEHLINGERMQSKGILEALIIHLNYCRERFIETGDKLYWWQIIELLPASYNQLRTVQLNYAVLRNMYHARVTHKLDEWRHFCAWVETLPYAKELITGGD